MRCEICNENDATIFLRGVVERETLTIALCATCGEGAMSPEQSSRLLHNAHARRSRCSEHFNEVSGHDPRYAKEAFSFVRDGLHRSATTLARISGHVTAKELLDVLRRLALERYDLTARERLRAWGITRTEDFGEIVFTLIEHGIFGRRPEDKKEDFSGGYDFETAFPVATP